MLRHLLTIAALAAALATAGCGDDNDDSGDGPDRAETPAAQACPPQVAQAQEDAAFAMKSDDFDAALATLKPFLDCPEVKDDRDGVPGHRRRDLAEDRAQAPAHGAADEDRGQLAAGGRLAGPQLAALQGHARGARVPGRGGGGARRVQEEVRPEARRGGRRPARRCRRRRPAGRTAASSQVRRARTAREIARVGIVTASPTPTNRLSVTSTSSPRSTAIHSSPASEPIGSRRGPRSPPISAAR